MSITYLVGESEFSFSYEDVKEEYLRFCEMTDDEFKANLPAALHLACVICYFKEVPTYVCLSDKGIIHELAHMIHIGDMNTTSTKEIRRLFKLWLKLA